MTLFGLLIVGMLAAGTVVWLVTYLKLIKSIGGRTWSPRLTFCKLLIPIDVVVTIVLVLAPMFTGIHGIHSFICSVFVAAGLSLGVAFTRRVLVPRWQVRYDELKAQGFQVVQ